VSQLPEVREADATPEIAAIYADIKESAAIPQVNLIFRYFASKPGALEWIWPAVRPIYRSQELADAAEQLTRSIPCTGPSPLGAALTGQDLSEARVVLDSYNSGNPQNLLALTAFVVALERREAPRARPDQALTPRTAVLAVPAAPFPALPRRDVLSPATMALIETMAARHPRAPGVIPSMYFHLALWPGALAAANTYLQPMIESPDWRETVDSVIEQARLIAEQLAPHICFPAKAPNEATLTEVSATTRAFIGQTIPEFVTVGRLLAIE
jgi:hypothetical protein